MELVATRGPHVLTQPVGIDAEQAAEQAQALSEIVGMWTVATPRAGDYMMRVVDVLARHVNNCDELAAALDEAAAFAGGHLNAAMRGEVCDLLLAASDSIRDALRRYDEHRYPERGLQHD